MAVYDLVVRGGTIVDGTGIHRYGADLAVKDGRIAMISGRIAADGAKEIDASGCIVAPGAVDLHTHYDAQLNWDPYATLSGWFGVTSLTIGTCGFGFAPTRPDDRELNMRMMNRIEAIPMESMRIGIRWDWETFPEYLDSLDRQGLGVNVGALVPFSPLRGYVLGMIPARQRDSVTDAELDQMKQIFYDAMKAGAFGISADMNLGDRPEDGGFLPSHVASKEEFLGLAEVLGQFGVGLIGWTLGTWDDREGQRELLTNMARSSGRPVHIAGMNAEDFAWLERGRGEGLPLVCQEPCMGAEAEFTLEEYNLFDYMSNWAKALVGSRQERAAKLQASGVREAMKRDVEERPDPRTDWSRARVLGVAYDRNAKYEGLTIEEIAKAEGKHPVDAFLDLALDEDLQTEFGHSAATREEGMREDRLKSPYVHFSISDGGAHTRFLTISTWPVQFLSYWVRDNGLMSLEEAHHKMSAFPAWLANFKDRGTLRVGAWADIMIYKLEELGYLYDKPIFDNDFPGGERRIVQKPVGLRNCIVNGTVTFEDNNCTGALPGKLLRSYDMVG